MSPEPPETSLTAREIDTQPDCWRRAARDIRGVRSAGFGDALPRPGERVAVTGCGTSWFMAQSYAALHEASGQGETDAFHRARPGSRPAAPPEAFRDPSAGEQAVVD